MTLFKVAIVHLAQWSFKSKQMFFLESFHQIPNIYFVLNKQNENPYNA